MLFLQVVPAPTGHRLSSSGGCSSPFRVLDGRALSLDEVVFIEGGPLPLGQPHLK